MKGEVIMERIASFQVDHIRLNRGIYVSRIDEINGNYLTSFDIRMKLPNREPVINIAELHTMEHLGATFLRNHSVWKEKIVYFGPMGCRTGFYLILKGKLESKDIVELSADNRTVITASCIFPLYSRLRVGCSYWFYCMG